MDRNLIKLCWDAIQRHTTRDTECLELYQVLEILSKEMEELQAEVEGLKCCGNCEHWDRLHECLNEQSPKVIVERTDKCPKWQKAGE